MKNTVESAGLRIAKYARVASMQDVNDAMSQLSLCYPIVLKTPAGMSTTDVFICSDDEETSNAIVSIVGKNSPDGRRVEKVLRRIHWRSRVCYQSDGLYRRLQQQHATAHTSN